MKNQALFSSKDKSEKLKCLLLQSLFGALKVKVCWHILACFPTFCEGGQFLSLPVCFS